jgi:hypothetical protein
VIKPRIILTHKKQFNLIYSDSLWTCFRVKGDDGTFSEYFNSLPTKDTLNMVFWNETDWMLLLLKCIVNNIFFIFHYFHKIWILKRETGKKYRTTDISTSGLIPKNGFRNPNIKKLMCIYKQKTLMYIH